MLPHYEFRRVIGVGGMGVVYLARQPGLDRWVAIKVLPLAASTDPEAAERFYTEARSMARLAHPHIVAVYDFGQTEAGHLYLAMEHVDGADLHRRTRLGEVTPDRARSVVAQLCEALQYAHEHGVIHRDIKPANILITPDWQVKVVDFGLARDLAEQQDPDEPEYGTPDYTAPERVIIGEAVDHRADIYSLGVVIHEILTGKTPRAAGAAAGQGLPPGFAGVLSKCLMRDPARRYQSAREVRSALLAAAAAAKVKPIEAPTTRAAVPKPSANAQAYGRQRASSATLGWGLLCLLALSALGWLVWRDHFQTDSSGASPASDAFDVVQSGTMSASSAEPGMMPAATSPVSPDMASNESAVASVPQSPSPPMNKAIPTALALAVTTATAFSVDYKTQIMPIFNTKCYACHSVAKGKVKGDVALDTAEKLGEVIGPGKQIIPGDPAKSTLLISCKLPDDDSDVMPPKGKNRLTEPELALLDTWIKEGASLTPGGGAPAPAPAPATAPTAPTAWSSNDGKTIQATFVALKGDQITLKMTANGQEFTFPLSRLSAESQAQAKAAAGQ